MEEKMAEDELRLYVVKRENLRKSMATAKSQASDILTFTLQWNDVEEHLLSVETRLENRSNELKSKEIELLNRSLDLDERTKVVEAVEANVDDLEIIADRFRKEIEEKGKEVVSLKNQVETCLGESKAEEMRLNQLKKSVEECMVEQRLKAGQLTEMVESLRKTQGELSVEKEHLFRTQTCRKELEEEIERKTKDLTVIGDRIVESGKQLKMVEEQVDVQHKLIATQSSELISKEKELESLQDSIRISYCDLDLSEEKIQSFNSLMTETSQQIESKAKQLENIQKLVEEQTCELNASLSHYFSIKLLIQEHVEELASREKKYSQMSEAICKLDLEIECKEKAVEKAENFIQQLCKKQTASENKLLLTERNLETTTAELESKKKGVQGMEDTLRKHLQDLASKGKELDSLKSLIIEKKKQAEVGEKKVLMKEEKLNLIKKRIRESSEELESTKKQHTKVEKSIMDLNAELKSIKKKTQDSIKDFNDEQEVRLKASLKEREQELSRKEKEKQLDTRSKKIELKDKKLDARKEKIDHKDHKLKSTEQKSLKSVKEYGIKTKALSSVCKQSKAGQRSNLLQFAERDEKSLQLLLRGHLKKCPQLHLDISSALKASSDPAKLVLDTIQGLQAAHQRMVRPNLDQNGVRWSSIFLLECLMEMSSKPKAEVEEEAIKFATEWKNRTQVKADNPVEVLGFLHFLAAFSLAFTFDAEKVQNLFDVDFLCKYGPSLCKALGVSALAPISDVLSLDDKLEQLPSQAPINTRSASRSPAVQEIAGLSQLDWEDALMDNEIPASLSHSEVSTGLQMFSDPPRAVLLLVEEALLGFNRQGESDLAESTVKNLVVVLEELTRIPRSMDSRLQLDASKLASQWNATMRTGTRVSSLEALAFLQFVVAYRLMDRINRDETFNFALSVAHFKQAPKIFDSLGLNNAIPNVVMKLLNSRQYVPAIRFMLSFNVQTGLSPLNLLEEEINGLKRSAMETRRFNPQVEDKDAEKLRDIIELIAYFKLEIDLPGNLIAKLVLSQESLNQNQSFSASPISIPPEVQVQAAHMAAHGPSTSQATNFRTPSSSPQVVDVETYQARGLTPFQGRSPQQRAGFKRPRVEPCVLRPVTRPGFEPPRTDRV